MTTAAAALGALALAAGALAQTAAATPRGAAHPNPHFSQCGSANTRLEHTSARAPSNLCVPASATDDNSTLLVWNKPEGTHSDVVDFRVYQDQDLVGTSSENAREHAPAQEYVEAFYQRDIDGFHTKTLNHSFKVTGLAPSTTYRFTVRAVYADGSLSEASAPVLVRTTEPARRVVVTDVEYGATGDGETLDTAALQNAIDECDTTACTVVVPAGTYRTGALFLHSDMTLDLQEGAEILGSDRWEDYPLDRGYYLYPVPDPVPTDDSYTAFLRPPSLINVLPEDNGRSAAGREAGDVAENVRIVGAGTIDGDGWKRSDEESVTDEAGNELPQYRASNAGAVADDGILAADQVQHAVDNRDDLPGIVNPPEEITDKALYGNYRSSLMTFMGVKGLYLEGISVRNPAYHGVMFLDSSGIGVYGTRHTTFNANNGDGLEFGGSSNGVVTGNFFDTGDDVINFAAGQGKYGARGHSAQDVWMFGNYLRKGHGGVAIGSHTAAWVQHLLAEDNVIFRTETGGLRMKSTSNMAGGARDVIFRDTPMACLKTSAFIASLSYTQSSSGYVGAQSADFRDIDVRNVSVDGNDNSAECGMADSNDKPVIDIEAGPHAGGEAGTVGPFTYEDVRFRNVNPTEIHGLTDSTFTDVCFATVLDDQNPWNLDEYSTGNTFEDVNPAPGGAPTGTCAP